MLKQKERLKYKSNVENQDKLRARAKETADTPKLSRGRKPKAKDDNLDENPLQKPKGRPRNKGVVNV